MLKFGRGIVSIAEENKVEFGTRLIEYYENEASLDELAKFIYEKCLDGIDSAK